MISRFRGKCETCHKPINRGSPIGWSKRLGAHHAACCGMDGDEIRAASLDGLAALAAEAKPALSGKDLLAIAAERMRAAEDVPAATSIETWADVPADPWGDALFHDWNAIAGLAS